MAKGDEKGLDGSDNHGNTNLSKLKRDLRDTAVFLDRQKENEIANIAFAKSDWMKGLCEGKAHSYDLASKFIMNNLERYEGVE